MNVAAKAPRGLRVHIFAYLMLTLARNCNDDRILITGQDPGDCLCKANVEGDECSACKDGYMNLIADNAEGCQECDCDGPGSASDKCKDGACQCKANVEGIFCDECKEGACVFFLFFYIGFFLNNRVGQVFCPRRG